MPRPGATQEVLVDEQRGHESWRVSEAALAAAAA
jgi:hypothetical protein